LPDQRSRRARAVRSSPRAPHADRDPPVRRELPPGPAWALPASAARPDRPAPDPLRPRRGDVGPRVARVGPLQNQRGASRRASL